MTDYILERASIGSVIASSLGNEDPENNPELELVVVLPIALSPTIRGSIIIAK